MISKGTHVKFVRFALFTVSEKAKTWLPGLLRTLTEQDIEKIVEDITRTHKTQIKKGHKGGEGAVCWLHERETTERTWGKERVGTNFGNILCRSEKERIRSKCNKIIIRFVFCDIQNNQGLSKGYQPQLTSSNNCFKFANTRNRGRVWLFEITEKK